MKSAYVAVLFLGFVPACGGPAALRKDYAEYSGCPEDKIETKELGLGRVEFTSRYRVSGCGNGTNYICRSTDDACASAQVTVARRHAKQFECRLSEVATEYLDGGSWQATGCGHTMTYQCLETEQVLVRCLAETDERRRGSGND